MTEELVDHIDPVDHPADATDRLTDSARECLAQALDDAGLHPPEDMGATLVTRFQRITLAAREGSERLTCDLAVRLSAPDGETGCLREGMIVVETKSERGESPADRALADLGLELISLSKYRVGMSLVGGAGETPQPGSDLFER